MFRDSWTYTDWLLSPSIKRRMAKLVVLGKEVNYVVPIVTSCVDRNVRIVERSCDKFSACVDAQHELFNSTFNLQLTNTVSRTHFPRSKYISADFIFCKRFSYN